MRGHHPMASKELEARQVLASLLGENGVLGHPPHTWVHGKMDLLQHVADKVQRRMCCNSYEEEVEEALRDHGAFAILDDIREHRECRRETCIAMRENIHIGAIRPLDVESA